ncbi:branched-chain amino acid ABC transporter permease [Glaciimonas sp. Gout2]|uniref:branched-chain amino acid ABC transporter permease n=1 Tax=unclassified Glaciimonas TaxID=2644401 RepID=UPI002AB35E9F|nr:MULTISPECIES: branched-chain amino acid ABC transporter permease [unclassified Glaciimonas]MDY7545288.1 branched-chain amino acid ABC transporter permease [Glaciimonas sp. CA11.2]MEB0013841.1 branched-chain amino acid ABC transporter permease [Glaciimonas sp. Cout2]MEB0083056.1 branched-chain amino acid ABC transporter permease [Glaciimonas sp. Gout2]
MMTQILFSGLALGSIYGLVALGFAVIFKATGVFNFAQGMLVVVGAYLAVTGSTQLGLPFPMAVVFIVLSAALLGAAIHALLIRPLAGRPLLPVIMITIALAIVLRAMIELIYGPQARSLMTPLPTGSFLVGGVRISELHLTAALVSWACMAGVGAFFKFTSAGLLMRATADSHEAALVSGINVNRINALAWAIGCVLAAIGGVFLGQLQVATVELENIGLLALPAVVIGGLQSIPGAIVGGLLVGLIEQFGSAYISPKARDILIYAPLLMILMVRPWGLFGQRELGRV